LIPKTVPRESFSALIQLADQEERARRVVLAAEMQPMLLVLRHESIVKIKKVVLQLGLSEQADVELILDRLTNQITS
jgi:hypothetical protein